MNSRITRRTKFYGGNGAKMSNHSDFNAHHAFGTYVKDVKEHELDAYQSLVHNAVKHGFRHAGSKTIKQLKAGLR